LRARKGKNSFSLQELKQLNIGDYVVHSDKGIGQFDGFETVLLGVNKQDCIKIIFADNDVLYVNLTYIHKVEKYASKEGVEPRLSKLGSAEWTRKKSRAKKKLKDIARELIKLYAKRKMQKGHAFDLDGLWQKELEASFIYEDTPDQAKTTVDVKEDMEASTPMDRLVCGDVGFGKTEIAVRAAFKAVQSGKQTAILVPTTILAQQHFMTFKDRLSQYPVNVEVISRFRSKKEQTKILENVKAGITDILIGTHRILSKDVEFKDLGLLVIDEEQRFGVSAKEKLRQMRVAVDSLTLTATPIPRTLNFSMMGARDLSIISTPPRNRMPVETFVMQENEDKIVKAITSEVERKGQVYFVSNKVHDLEKITEKLRKLMPSVQFGIAHGQMRPSDLEKVMEQFIKRNFDVLVCTKIIESGLDIPNANTMIINRANHFGLAELYQLRGRVGRTNTQAFCYLLIPPVSLLPPKTLRRLQAIEEFTDLGSGFRLAMRDLEIRGAGNLLGAEQSGYIDDMGFELYQKILEEAVAELRAEEFGELFKDRDDFKSDFLKNSDIAIEIDSDAFIPADYIKSNTERFEFYRQLYNVPTNGELDIIREEMEDRFGKLPDEVLDLIFAVKLRIASLMTGFVKIGLRNNRLTAEFPSETNSEYYETAFPEITEFLNEIPGAKIYQHRKTLLLDIDVENRDEAVEVLWRIKQTAQFVVE
jgi:transcription-repair coupling factor (superfamily II helicase)